MFCSFFTFVVPYGLVHSPVLKCFVVLSKVTQILIHYSLYDPHKFSMIKLSKIQLIAGNDSTIDESCLLQYTVFISGTQKKILYLWFSSKGKYSGTP
jgi:hypothetical protein